MLRSRSGECTSFRYIFRSIDCDFLIPPLLPASPELQRGEKEVSESSLPAEASAQAGRTEAAISLRHFDFVTNRFALGQNQSDFKSPLTGTPFRKSLQS